MKWLLVIVLLTPEGESPAMEPRAYPSEAECWEAAEGFIAHHPNFELRARSTDRETAHPAARSYVECVPETPEARGEGFTAAS